MKLTKLEKRVLARISERYLAYSGPFHAQYSQDLRNHLHDFDEADHFDRTEIKQIALEIDNFLVQDNRHEHVILDQRIQIPNSASDIAPVRGYGAFIENTVVRNVPVQFQKIMRCPSFSNKNVVQY